MVRKGKETKFWADITADMMSEEEQVGDVYVRHPPHYRSEKFNKFIGKLDERASKKSKSHARFSRKEGSPRKVPIPKHAKQWMIEAKPPQDEVESGTYREVDEPVGGDSVMTQLVVTQSAVTQLMIVMNSLVQEKTQNMKVMTEVCLYLDCCCQC